ncbi:MAG: tetratricopeptide repeat protein [bacterium]|nr:tetratricopeptide repeat protein [bacterium]
MSDGSEVDELIHRALALHNSGRLDEAAALCKKILRLQPGHADALHLLGLAVRQAGEPEIAAVLIGEAIKHNSSVALYHYNLSGLRQDQGKPSDALAALDEAIRLDPDLAEAHNKRGDLLCQLGRLTEALGALDQALSLSPDYAGAHNYKGNALRELRRAEDALEAYDEALRLQPHYAEAHSNRGIAFRDLGRLQDALDAHDEALRLRPDLPEAHNNRGNALRELGRMGDALEAYDEALRLKPHYADAHNNKGIALRELGRTEDALQAYDHALRLRPDYADAHNNRGNVLKDQGRYEEALAAYKRALRIRPDYSDVHSNYLFCLNYDPAASDAALFEAHREWGERFGHPEHRFTTYSNAADADRTLRVGLVSADFARHPTGYFLDAVLPAVDPGRIQFYCYSGRARSDDLTERLKQSAAGWRSSIGLSDQALAEAIRSDGIDILMDLCGHTAGSRLTCFGLKPAPVQVTWLGSCHTTGVPAIDYILMDPTYMPADGERWFTETVVRLPDIRWCYAPPDYAPAVTPPPVLRQGHITFGSFNNLIKVSAAVIALWARVLNAVPGAQLMLSWKTLADAGECARLREAFATEGIDADRLRLTSGPGNHAGVLADYGEVDIALDPFPFSGCLTTCETLWMGVPLVTLPMTRPASRQSLGFLTALGRTEWVAETPDDYVRIATGLANEPDYLATLRGDQRARVAASPMCDAPRFARNLEAALRQVWQQWCSEQP